MAARRLKLSRFALKQHFPQIVVRQLLQSTIMGVNVVFVNIDWQNTGHDNVKATGRNMGVLRTTITDIVRRMKPAIAVLV